MNAAVDPTMVTIDELAASVRMTARNVRAYAARGLLPPPVLRGRTGFYGPEHHGRLVLIRRMQDQGFTLAAVESFLQRIPAGSSAASLELQRVLLEPFRPEQPDELSRAELADRLGRPVDDATLSLLVELELARPLPGGRVLVSSPRLLRVAATVLGFGVPADAVAAVHRTVRAAAQSVADAFVGLFRDHVWRAFADAGMPAERWPDLQRTVDDLVPLASESLAATFNQVMARAAAEAVHGGPPGAAATPGAR